jgi:hypothetical protein
MADVSIHEEKRENPAPRVQFPEGLSKSPSHPYSRQDSDATTSLATDDDDSEDYDWSDEEDLVDEEAKFRGQMSLKAKKSGWGFKRSANFTSVPVAADSEAITGSFHCSSPRLLVRHFLLPSWSLRVFLSRFTGTNPIQRNTENTSRTTYNHGFSGPPRIFSYPGASQ